LILNCSLQLFLLFLTLKILLDDEDWLSNVQPPWENKEDVFEDAKDEFSDNEAEEVFDVVKLFLLLFLSLVLIREISGQKSFL
jgi:hypothetical protein